MRSVLNVTRPQPQEKPQTEHTMNQNESSAFVGPYRRALIGSAGLVVCLRPYCKR